MTFGISSFPNKDETKSSKWQKSKFILDGGMGEGPWLRGRQAGGQLEGFRVEVAVVKCSITSAFLGK